eukprot:scaffold19268_cov148-Skeletonema_menzelii.AAC.7
MDCLPELSYAAPKKDQFPLQSSSWRNALYDILSSVEANVEDDAIILFKTSKFVCTYDKFPKARHHLLLMCRHYSSNPSCLMNVKSMNDLTKDHLDELREFHNLAKSIVAAISRDVTKSNPFKIGYHSIPSLHPLHLHIISSDLDSPCITSRKHIVSFSSDFFVSSEELENHLESAFVDSVSVAVRVQRAQDVLDSTPLQCQYCGRAALNVPDFKRHNQTCPKATAPNNLERAHNDNGYVHFNSLLGWSSKRDLAHNDKASGRKRSRRDIELNLQKG